MFINDIMYIKINIKNKLNRKTRGKI